jgi:uncharacterized protein (TIGR02145 family)
MKKKELVHALLDKILGSNLLFILLTTTAFAQASSAAFTDPRDNQQYKIVKIGTQTWMAKNLNYNVSGSWCYDNKPENCTKKGRLYDWEMAMKACPDGWHLSSNAEWQILVDFAGGDKVTGTKLKAKSEWNTGSGYKAGTNTFGFSAFPGGYRSSDGLFYYAEHYSSWWSANKYDANNAYSRNMHYDREDTYQDYSYEFNGFSVRCLKD